MRNGIKEIAKAVGVSQTTVSRALNNEPYVRKDLRRKILETAEIMNYEPNYLAKSLLKNKTNIIGVAVSDIATSFFSTILKCIERRAAERGYNILFCNVDDDLEKEKRGFSIFRQMRVDGIILTHERVDLQIIEQLKAMSNIPMVACSCHFEEPRFISVNINDTAAAYDAVAYLHSIGHRKIAYLGSRLDEYTVGTLRHNGVQKAFSELGLPELDTYIDLASLGIEDGYRMGQRMLAVRSTRLPTAIFAGSDDVAVGLMNCLMDNGYRIPEDFSIIGFDNSIISRNVRPMLTTVQQPIDKIGTDAIDALIDLIEQKGLPVREIVLPHEIVPRGSCKPWG